MTEKERFQRAFAPLHASPDTMTEVMKMTEQRKKKNMLSMLCAMKLGTLYI